MNITHGYMVLKINIQINDKCLHNNFSGTALTKAGGEEFKKSIAELEKSHGNLDYTSGL